MNTYSHWNFSSVLSRPVGESRAGPGVLCLSSDSSHSIPTVALAGVVRRKGRKNCTIVRPRFVLEPKQNSGQLRKLTRQAWKVPVERESKRENNIHPSSPRDLVEREKSPQGREDRVPQIKQEKVKELSREVLPLFFLSFSRNLPPPSRPFFP